MKPFILKLLIIAVASLYMMSCSKKRDEPPKPSSSPPVTEEPSVESPSQSYPYGTELNFCPDVDDDESLRRSYMANSTGEYIVVLKEENTNGARTGREDRVNRFLSRRPLSSKPSLTYQHNFSGFVGQMTPEEAEELSKDPEVESVEPDRIISIEQEDVEIASLSSNQITPWGIRRVGGFASGKGKVAWVLDTGIDLTHPDLNVDKERSISFINGSASPDDDNGHGTHVAGTIAAIDNEIGVVGVAAGATVVAVKVMNAEGKGRISSIIRGVEYVTENANRGDVINFSLGGAGISPALERSVDNATKKGIYLAMAAGNSSTYACLNSPQRMNGPFLYTVSAMDVNDNFASFSNYGTGPVDYCAPGVRVISTSPGGTYSYSSGTSMAAPHVAGLLLLHGDNFSTSGYVNKDPDNIPDPIAFRKQG
ncbi:S8 family serine peptidase [Cytophagaceae bacterium ABcell3]|nr:S8 family serine peptidase [Cytophagaceae bacterium ABcell3]